MELIEEVVEAVEDARRKIARPLKPKKIVRKLERAARKHAKEWRGDMVRDAPNYYVVEVSREDWRSYYQLKRDEVARMAAGSLRLWCSKNDLRMDCLPKVSIKASPDLMIGQARVTYASFGTPMENTVYEPHNADWHHRPSYFRKQPTTVFRQASTHAARCDIPFSELCTEYVGGDVSIADPSPCEAKQTATSALETEKAAEEVTPALRRNAKLAGPGFTSSVKDGDVVGVLRKKSKSAPDIKLPANKFEAASHEHGKFAYRNGSYVYTDTSKNGTIVVMPNGKKERLAKGQSTRLISGSELYFAEDGPVLFSIAS